MGVFSLSKVCALLLAGYLSAEVAGNLQNGPHSDRVLRAATKRSDLYRRSMRIGKKFESEVAYIEEENGWSGKSVFASQVKVSSKKPILNLEEVEHHLQEVQCGEGKMKLRFVDSVSAIDARAACHNGNGGLIITSHESCNKDGERAVYKVNDVSFGEDGEALELSVIESLWKDAFDTFDISFGHTAEDHFYRRHVDFQKIRRKRQDDASVTVPPVTIPSDTPDDVNSVTFDLSKEIIDTTFDPSDFTSGIENIIAIPDLPVEIGCKNCSTTGTLELTQGAINIDIDQIDIVPDIFEGGDDGRDIGSVITGGFMELKAMGMGAHIELFARPKLSGSFTITLFTLPILGFVIPGIGKAGAVFEANLAADYDVTKPGIEINYGFDVNVPDDSNVRIELVNIADSGINGFTDATLTPIPFKANISDVEILLGLAFQPTVPIGFEFNDKMEASVDVSLDLPRLDAKLTTKLNADTNCQDLPGGNSTNSTIIEAPFSNNTGLAQIGPLVLVEANISVSVDVGFDLKFPLLPPPLDGINTEANIFSTAFPLSSSCLAPLNDFAPATDVYGPPKVTANATAKDTAQATPTQAHPTGSGCNCACDCQSSTIMVWVPPTDAPTPSQPIQAPPAEETPCTTSTAIYSNTSLLEIPIPSTPIISQPPPVSEPPVVPSGAPPSNVPTGGNVTAPTGFLGGSTPSATAPAEQFTGAATPGAIVPSLNWVHVRWQSGVFVVSLIAGALML